jgi:hypothetical protein
MLRIDAYYLYSTGAIIHPLEEMRAGDDFQQWALPMYSAQSRLEQLFNQSVFKLKTSLAAANKLYDTLTPLTDNFERDVQLTGAEAFAITEAIRGFETVLSAELGLMNIYLVTKKRGYDTTDIITNGIALFPDDLAEKVPDAVKDINEGTRCIAFELPTAAGFHLHRANESVLHRYYDVVMNGAPRPSGRNIGDYLKAMNDANAGDLAVRSSLKDLKDLHRNPLIHPEHSLDSVDDAIALLGGIQSVVVHMLKTIPKPAPLAPNAALPSGPATVKP